MSVASPTRAGAGVTAVRQVEATHGARFAPDGRNSALGSYLIADDATRIYFERFSPGEGWARLGDRHPRDAPAVLVLMGLGANGRLGARREAPACRRLSGDRRRQPRLRAFEHPLASLDDAHDGERRGGGTR